MHLGGLGNNTNIGVFPQGHQSQTHNQVGPSWANSDTYYEGRYGGRGGPPPPGQGAPPPNQGPSYGSEILDSNPNDTKLDKSNILLLGPTGSGKIYRQLRPSG